ncbi:MAG: hypothetical protein P8Y81_09520, partial [Ignavibacteriaceae bacterium]
MQDNELTAKRAASTLKRLLPLLTEKYKNKVEEGEWLGYIQRLGKYFPKLFELLQYVYGTQYDFFYHLSEILNTATQAWIDRPAELKALDAIRENDPLWYQSNRMVGAVCYVDLFSVDLKG